MRKKVIGNYSLQKKKKKAWQTQELSLQYSLHTLHLLNGFQNESFPMGRQRNNSNFFWMKLS